MSELDALPKQFEQLLEGIRGKHSLEEWRHAYRKIIYSGAKRIFDDFPVIIIGPPPGPSSESRQQHQQQQPQQQQQQQQQQQGPTLSGGAARSPGTAGQQPPYHPSAICQYVCTVLGN